ncbi:MAG: DUF1512 domain-containing protein [Candidatus Bathyarchaeia archaeon]
MDSIFKLQLFPFGKETDLSNIFTIIFYLLFIVFIFFGQKIQVRMMLWEISGALKKLEYMKNEGRELSIKTIKEIGKPKEDPTPSINILLEQFLITPVDMDPAGIVWKLDHLLDVRENKFKDDVRRIAPEADDAQLNNLENLVEASLALNTLYRIIRHYYLLGKKTMSFYIILQIQMLLPIIMQEAEAIRGALKAFAQGMPIGDGIGALVASKLMRNNMKRKMEKDIIVSETIIEGRRAIALKAEGPGGNVGKPGDAVKRLVEENEGKLAMVIMVDAAVKFEGEATGEISEGIGAAIGGIGTEKYKIEEEAARYKIPLHAIIIKQSVQEAITPMKKEIFESAEKVLERIKKLILERTKEGDAIIIAGIGNTVGIGQ